MRTHHISFGTGNESINTETHKNFLKYGYNLSNIDKLDAVEQLKCCLQFCIEGRL